MKPYRERIEGMSIQFKEQLNSLYEQGYKEGQKSSCDCRDNMDNEYNRGLNDAWKCARKIGHNSYVSLTEMGFEGLDSSRNASFDCIMKFSPSEAIAKIKEYEGKKNLKEKGCGTCKHNNADCRIYGTCYECLKGISNHYEEKQKAKQIDDEIRVGDEVIFDRDEPFNVVVVAIKYCDGVVKHYIVMADNGLTWNYVKPHEVMKTGRHFDQIEEVSKALRGE